MTDTANHNQQHLDNKHTSDEQISSIGSKKASTADSTLTLNADSSAEKSTALTAQDAVLRSDNEPPSEQPQPVVAETNFSTFSTNQKRAIIAAGSTIGFLSPLAGGIYFPALPVIAESLDVTVSQINLTVTTYLILQGIAPTFVAGIADSFGRRPAFIGCLTLFLIANLGLGLQNSYPALLGLRCLQSAGSSGTIALANSVVGDLVTPAERGSYMAYTSVGSVLGPSLAPIIGGLISYYVDWHWIFWFLMLVTAGILVPLVLFLPETCRKVVGDGSIPPPPLNWCLADFVRHRHHIRDGTLSSQPKRPPRPKFNPLALIQALFILLDPTSLIILLSAGLSLANFYAISTGATSAIRENYGFNEIQVSLMYLPIGIGSFVSTFTTGRLIDFNYRRHAKKLGMTVNKKVQQDLSEFPLERARLEIALPFFVLASLAIIAYGWTLDLKVSIACPIIFLFLLGYFLVAAFQSLNVIMTDIWPGQVASAMAANNLCRCELGAAASAAIQPMSTAMGRGWAYTTLAGILLICQPSLVYLMKHGIEWRKKKVEKQKRKAEKQKSPQ